MTRVCDIYDYLCALAPLELQMGFDNSGFQLGRKDAKVNSVLLALDVTEAVVDEAVKVGAQLIVSHHPLIFTPLKSVQSEKLLKIIEHKIAVISMHTNLDIAEGGVNDVLMERLGAKPECSLDSDGCGRVGTLPEAESFDSFLLRCKAALNANGLRYYYAGKTVEHIAVMGGSGGDYIAAAAKMYCDTYVTADIKYHQFLEAAELGINLIDADHFCTENPVIPVLCARLAEKFEDVSFKVSETHGQLISFI